MEYVPKLASNPGQSRWPLDDDDNNENNNNYNYYNDIYSEMNHYEIDNGEDDNLVSCYLVNTTTNIITTTTNANTNKPTLFRVER